MGYDDIRQYLATKCPSVDKLFIDVVQNAFNEGKELDFTLIQPVPIVLPPLFLLPTFCLVMFLHLGSRIKLSFLLSSKRTKLLLLILKPLPNFIISIFMYLIYVEC